MSEPTTAASPPPYVVVDSPYEVARWRPLVHWLMFIPHMVISGALQAVQRVTFVVYWFGLLFTGKLIPGLYGMQALYERYNTRASYFLFGFTEKYPPFDFNTGPDDNGAHPPVRLNLPEPPASVPRKHLANILLAVPHYIVIMIIAIAALITLIIGWFAVVFTGAWPKGMRDFLVRFANYYYRVWTYVTMVDNRYPKFGLPA